MNKHFPEFTTTTQVSSVLQNTYIFLVFVHSIEKNVCFEVQSHTGMGLWVFHHSALDNMHRNLTRNTRVKLFKKNI